MTFKDKKIPKHLILQEEFEFHKKPKINLLKLSFWCLLLIALIYALMTLEI